MFLSTLFANTLNLCFSLNVRDLVSQPYNTTGNIIEHMVQNQNIVIENLSFEKVEKFKYLGVTVTNTDSREEIESRINLGNAACFPRN